MKPEFLKYLDDINLSQIMKTAVMDNYAMLCIAIDIEQFQNIHISERMRNDGRVYYSLWGFTQTLLCRCKLGNINMADNNKISIFKIKNIVRLSIEDINFDLKNPTENASLEYLVRTLDMDIPYFIAASGMNCSNLRNVMNKYILNSLKA